ncbi:hypothetical protein SS1G_05883 [Sclerotinia sclerotiorum 1980 UF-70]|uniref:XPG-I domain-containing protein n=1 Tax=Sclerotinia sclerotiorum (strain ATCC 18683 / 1980 / Ss-1) TaxID=665079 RepID=A7EKN6_SCLS1|nr:hypothetical protein SS1G_05883 [Sclerotinia sclerotiorum 1980 UF-70]EDO03402.1 hypothetical protein SS1G_05883 [Sclerotinia sclerotiorum 1980 UF-70]
MGIKGIYGEIGPGKRVSLSKISIEKFEKTGIPLRIAIDISIWNFQIQAGQGGTNPALRTLYYRLLRLLSISVQPLFVFDGPHKPPVKRNKQTGRGGASIPDLMTKELLKLFGFEYHIAPGEAEAECALLQREGVVDAVLSEDVDTLMFGSGLTFRSWSSEKKSGAGTPTHVNVYDAKATKAGRSGLDREGMILVALMSGGDYKTEGIPGCGVKVACEAARAGFGKRLCQIRREDAAAYDEWRADLAHELFTNESKFFRTKRKALQIPEDFPDRKVLGYYTHPVVSSLAKVERLRDQIIWEGDINVPKLRHFVADAFEWKGKEGAKKFVRGLAPALLLTKLRQRGDRQNSGYDDPMLTKLNEMELVKAICGQRKHITTDEVPEMRVIYQPLEIVDINLDEEHDEIEDYGRDGLAPLLEDDQIQAYASDDAAPSDSPRRRGPSPYDPMKADKLWIFETIVKVGVPLTVEDYEEALRDPKRALKQKAAAKKAETKTTKPKTSTKATGGMPKGALDRYVEISEKGTRTKSKVSSQPVQNFVIAEEDLPPHFLAPNLRSPKSPEETMSSYKTAASYNYSPGRIIDLTSSPPGTPVLSYDPAPLDRDYDESPGYPKLVLPSSSPVTMKNSPQYQAQYPAHDHDICTPTYHTTINVHTTIYNITQSPSPSPLKSSKLPKPSKREQTKTIRKQTIETQIVEESFDEKKKEKNSKRYIMLRESLPGSWREVGREELIEGRSRAWRAEEVEVLDLTGEF